MQDPLSAVCLLFVLLLILVVIFADQIVPYELGIKMNGSARLLKPCAEHIFGCDNLGRDMFSRMVHGTRNSLSMGIGVTAVVMVTGTVLGAICAYYGGVLDMVIMRILEGINALPTIVFALTLITVLGDGIDKLIICLTVVNLPGIARLVRSQVLSIREKEFVECAKGGGASSARIMFKYILPQCSSPLIIRFTSGLGGAILSQASLAFLGVGMDPRIPNWGGIINEGRAMVMAMPYQCAYAGVAIMITTLAFSILGDGLRDILDPKLR